MKVKSQSEVAQLCPTLHDPMDYSLPGFSVHGIFQARVLEWGALAFSVKHFLVFLKRWNLVTLPLVLMLFVLGLNSAQIRDNNFGSLFEFSERNMLLATAYWEVITQSIFHPIRLLPATASWLL